MGCVNIRAASKDYLSINMTRLVHIYVEIVRNEAQCGSILTLLVFPDQQSKYIQFTVIKNIAHPHIFKAY